MENEAIEAGTSFEDEEARGSQKRRNSDNSLLAAIALDAKRFAPALHPLEAASFPLGEHFVPSESMEPSLEPYRISSPVVIDDWLQTFKTMSKQGRLEALEELVSICEPTLVRHLEAVIAPRFQRDFLGLLPSEVVLKILNHLHPQDLCHVAQVSKTWLRLAEDSSIWAKKCEQLPMTSNIRRYPPALGRRENWEVMAAANQHHQEFLSLRRSNVVLINLHSRQFLPLTQRIRNPSWPSATTTLHSCSHSRTGGTGCSSPATSSQWSRPGTSRTGLDSCLVRARRKAEYLRCHRIVNNWRRRRPAAECQLRGHEEHVITCLQMHGDLIVTGSDDNTIRVWSAATGQCIHVLIGHSGGVWTLLLSEDGELVISGSTDRSVCVWSVAGGERIHTLHGHVSTVRCMAVKGSTLVSGSRDCTLRVWNILEGICLRVLQGHAAAVRSVQFDGSRIISGGYDHIIIVWDAESGRVVHTLEGHTNRVYSLLLDSERDLVVSGSLDTTIRIWNIKTGECLQTLVGHQSLTSGMQLRGNTLLSANADSTIRVWDIRDGRCIHTLSGQSHHTSAVTSLQILDDMVLTSGDDGTVKLWDLDTGSFICDLVRLDSSGAGGCIWRLKATKTMLVCAAGSRNGTEDTKLILMDFDAPYP